MARKLNKKQWNTIKMLVRRRLTAEENRLRKMVGDENDYRKDLLQRKINDLLEIEEILEEISPI